MFRLKISKYRLYRRRFLRPRRHFLAVFKFYQEIQLKTRHPQDSEVFSLGGSLFWIHLFRYQFSGDSAVLRLRLRLRLRQHFKNRLNPSHQNLKIFWKHGNFWYILIFWLLLTIFHILIFHLYFIFVFWNSEKSARRRAPVSRLVEATRWRSSTSGAAAAKQRVHHKPLMNRQFITKSFVL